MLERTPQRAPIDTPGPVPDVISPELAQIDALEAATILAHDQKMQFAPEQAEELARQRPAVVAQAKARSERLREELRVRRTRS